ncbi:MAG: hypothetical protein GXO16_03165, partial [Epsilonproteobacteria bacterium]|nr:hypothetical protein [Campylobacterota bacterium]
MSFIIRDKVIQTTAVDSIKDNLMKARTATGGAIDLGTNIHKGDFIEEIFFNDFGNIQRRDPNSSATVEPEQLSNTEDVAVKLYFRGDTFFTNTQVERYGTTAKNVNAMIGKKLGEKVVRWAIEKGLIAAVA